MTCIRYIAMALVVVALAAPAGAQTPGRTPVRTATGAYTSALDDPRVQTLGEKGLDLLYNMKLAEAAVVFDEVERLYPNHPIGAFLHGLIDWWQILPELHEEGHDPAFMKSMGEVIKRSDRLLKRDKNNFDAIFFKGAALGLRGRLLSNRGEWFKAAADGKQALDYVMLIAEKDPNNADFIFGKGVYDYFAATVPKKYPVVKPVMVFFPDGDRDLGLRELQRVADHGRFIRTEAVYFLLQIYMIYEPNYAQSLRYAQWLREEHPDNGFFHSLEGRVHAQWGRWRDAFPVYEDVLARARAGQPGYTDTLAEQALYFLARGKMNFRDYDTALAYLRELERVGARSERTSYFEVMGLLRQGMVYDMKGQREQAKAHYRRVLRLRDVGEAHERAKGYLKHPFGV